MVDSRRFLLEADEPPVEAGPPAEPVQPVETEKEKEERLNKAAKKAARSRAGRAWAGFMATLDSKQKSVLYDYRIIESNGKYPVVTQYLMEGGVFKEKMSMDAAQRLLALDTTPDRAWTSWVFFQAGGGAAAKAINDKCQNGSKKRCYYNNSRKGVPEAEIDEIWAEMGPALKEIMISGDADLIKSTEGGFGYSYDFPGAHNRYDNVEKAVSRFMSVYDDGLRMNQALVSEKQDPIRLEPDALADVEAMNLATTTIIRYWKAVQARADVRVGEWPDPLNALGREGKTLKQRQKFSREWRAYPAWKKRKTVYDDDFVTVVVPLTYAAAVEYGDDAWDVSNYETFDTTLKDKSQDNPWTSQYEGTTKVVAFLEFNKPMPAQVQRVGNKPRLSTPQKLLVTMLDNGTTVLKDTAGNKYTPGEIRRLILAERTRPETERDLELRSAPYGRGANVYKKENEDTELVAHFDAAVDALSEWAFKYAGKVGLVKDPFGD